MSLVRAIGIMLVLALCLPVLGTFTSPPGATPLQAKPVVVSLPAAAATKPVAVTVTPASPAKPVAAAATMAAATVGSSPHAAIASPGAATSPRPPAAAKPAAVKTAGTRADHAPPTPIQPVTPQRAAAKTQAAPSPAASQHAFTPAVKPQQRAAAAGDDPPRKVIVNTRAHWLPKLPAQSREPSRTASRDRKETQTYSAFAQRDRATDPRATPVSRTASRHDDAPYDRGSYSTAPSRNVAARAGYQQPQDYGRRDPRAGASPNKRQALLREYRENARRQSEIERELGGGYPHRPATGRYRYSDASSGRR